MKNSLNQLEPQGLVDAFLKHPPQQFTIQHSSDAVDFFTTTFDLTSTLDTTMRQRLLTILGDTYWQRFLHVSACFVGTTVTEYTHLLRKTEPADLMTEIKQQAKQATLTIIKDLPLNSPLLSVEENQYSQQLIREAQVQGFIAVEGQALAYVPIDFGDRDAYLARLSKSRRKNLRRKLKSLQYLRVEDRATGDACFSDQMLQQQLYQLYLAVYEQSDIHFDLLSPEFFAAILQDGDSQGRVFFYWHAQTLVGYNICYIYKGNLVDKYIGFDYALALQHNLYFVSWFINLDYAVQHGLKFYIAGWTDPEVKAQLGAKFTFTQHLVWIKQPILRYVLGRLKPLFEADAHWHKTQRETT